MSFPHVFSGNPSQNTLLDARQEHFPKGQAGHDIAAKSSNFRKVSGNKFRYLFAVTAA